MSYDEDPKLKPDDGSEEKQEEHFSFLQETIKPKQVSREQVTNQLVRIAIYGLIFGLFACLGFYALRPWVQDHFQENPKTVTIPEDEVIDEILPTEQEPAEPVAPTLTSDSYKDIMKSIYEIAKEANKGVAFVKGADDENAWKAGGSGTESSVTGLIVGDNGQELLILADNSVCADCQSWTVTFADNSQYSAALKKQDKNRGLAVFGVTRSGISTNTWNSIKTATLGNSNISTKGDVVIALGNMFGYGDGVAYGILSSNEYTETFPDGMYDVLATDIAASSRGTGVLFNQKGEVTGLILPEIWKNTESNTANALAISDLKSVIELLVNGQSVPYLGVYGVTVTEEISKAQDIPVGVYVTQVKADSPAMAAGIQNGDVISQVAGAKVTNTLTYEKAVLESKVGEEIKLKGQRRGANGYVDIDFTVLVGSQE